MKNNMTDEQFWLEFQQMLEDVNDKGDEALINALNSAPWYKEDRIKQEDEEDNKYRRKIVKWNTKSERE